jgi:hypothetical protein
MPPRRKRDVSQKSKRRSGSSSKSNKKQRVEPVPGTNGVFWEIERVKDFRIRTIKPSSRKGSGKKETSVIEFLVQWKGSFDDTWEPAECLCDSALAEARQLLSDADAQKLGLESLDDDDGTSSNNDDDDEAYKPVQRVKFSDDDEGIDGVNEDDDEIDEEEDVEGFWEIEKIKAFRTSSKGHLQFRVQWKGPYSDTWEPKENLSEVALMEAMALVERSTIDVDVESMDESDGNDDGISSPVHEKKKSKSNEMDDTHFEWNDASYITYLPIERIDVSDPKCRSRVTTARLMGIPVVLTGHVGWAQFARRWLVPMTTDESITISSESASPTASAMNKGDSGCSPENVAPVIDPATDSLNTQDCATINTEINSVSRLASSCADNGDSECAPLGIAAAIDTATESIELKDCATIRTEMNTQTASSTMDNGDSGSFPVNTAAAIDTATDSVELSDRTEMNDDVAENNRVQQDERTGVVSHNNDGVELHDRMQEGEQSVNHTSASLDLAIDAAHSTSVQATLQNPALDHSVAPNSENGYPEPEADTGDSPAENQRLTAASPETDRCEANGTESTKIDVPLEDVSLLDLSLPHKVDVQKMTDDIGDELVPILRKNYDESEPIKQHLTVRRFLRDCWPHSITEGDNRDSEEGQKEAALPKKVPRASLYMHQWLFTASETAVPKLCGEGKCAPLPNAILGEDLLRYWYNKERCNGDSPYQYLFMGNTGTMSKLHKDSGGYLISIAPIVGQKEVVLVHRDDASSLYDLYAKLDRPDLHFYPMLYSTRAWKSIVNPGEILIMPQGTYHQCRNVTPCLSYHRFHLDTVNLKAFYESMSEKDCKDHFEILWNVATELFSTVDAFVYDLRSHPIRPPEIPERIHSAVANLRILHKICRAVAMDFEKASDRENASEWNKLVSDVESTLHDFRYRRRDHIPNFRACHDRRDPSKRHAPDATFPEATKSRSSRKRHMASVAAEPKGRKEALATDLEFTDRDDDGNNSETCATQQASSSVILDYNTNRTLDDNQAPSSISQKACEQEIPSAELPSNEDLGAGYANARQPRGSTTDQLVAQSDEMNQTPLATQGEKTLDPHVAPEREVEAEEHEASVPKEPLTIVPIYDMESQSASGNDVEADLHEMQTQPDWQSTFGSYPDDENAGLGDPAQSTCDASIVILAQVQDA